MENEQEWREEGGLDEISFTVPGKPFGKQRPRVVHVGGFSKAYTPKETVGYEQLVRLIFNQKAKGRRFSDDAMIAMWIDTFYEVPKSASKSARNAMLDGIKRPTKKPDADNAAKIIADALNGIAYRDDSAIVSLRVEKYYHETPRVEVKIRRIRELWGVNKETEE